jgi:hypothetical protein
LQNEKALLCSIWTRRLRAISSNLPSDQLVVGVLIGREGRKLLIDWMRRRAICFFVGVSLLVGEKI